MISVCSFSFFLPQAVCQQDTLVEQFGFRRDEIISAKLYLGANNPAGLATSSYATERGAERRPRELLYGPTNHTCQGYGPGRQLRWAQQMDFCLSRLQLTNKETDPAAISASKQTRRNHQAAYAWLKRSTETIKLQLYLTYFSQKILFSIRSCKKPPETAVMHATTSARLVGVLMKTEVSIRTREAFADKIQLTFRKKRHSGDLLSNQEILNPPCSLSASQTTL